MAKFLTSEKYVKCGGSCCPLCQSKDVTGGCFDADGNYVWCEVSCEDCGATWDDIYVLNGYDNLKKGK